MRRRSSRLTQKDSRARSRAKSLVATASSRSARKTLRTQRTCAVRTSTLSRLRSLLVRSLGSGSLCLDLAIADVRPTTCTRRQQRRRSQTRAGRQHLTLSASERCVCGYMEKRKGAARGCLLTCEYVQGVAVGAGIGNIQEIVDVGHLIRDKVRCHCVAIGAAVGTNISLTCQPAEVPPRIAVLHPAHLDQLGGWAH